MKSFMDVLSRYQLGLVFIALFAGFVVPQWFLLFNPYNGFFLQVIMFATGLRLDFQEFYRELKDWRMMLLANSMMLVILPFLVTIPLKLFAPEWILPFVIAAAMPTGLTAPAVITILGGRTSIAILVAVSTSVLAPIFVPLMLNVLVGSTVAIDTVGMMLNIAYVVILPLALAAALQWKLGKKKVDRAEVPIRLANIMAFVLVIASVTAGSASAPGATADNFYGIGTDGLIITILMTVFWLGIAWLAASIMAWRNQVDRLTVAFCLIYMNTTLGIWVADTYFRETLIAPKLVAIFVATTLILPVFKFFMPKEKRRGFRRVFSVEQT